MTAAIHPRDGELWTSAEVAHAFRVGVSSVKRWTDDGELESVRTPGGHRRYTLDALHRFASIRGLSAAHLPPLPETVLRAVVVPPADVTLYDALATGNRDAIRHLMMPRVRAISQRAAFLDRVVGEALREIGYAGPVVIESFTSNVKSIARAAAIWRTLANTQDDLARDGLAFLKELLA